jgi:hypothetical protein
LLIFFRIASQLNPARLKKFTILDRVLLLYPLFNGANIQVSTLCNNCLLISLAGLIRLSFPSLRAPQANEEEVSRSRSVEGREGKGFKHVLLISIDGMHAVDFLNCSEGLTDINGGAPYCLNLARLRATGINYLETSTSKPSDSFPGLTAIVSGGSPRAEGVFYDVAYDRSLAPPAKTTGNGVAAGTCEISVFNGTRTEYEEGIDLDQSKLNGGAPSGGGGVNSIDVQRLPRDPANNCQPVLPWNFVRTNTIFGVVHQAGGYTAWSDKHPAYASVSGPSTKGPVNLDDFYAPEINSIPVALPGIKPGGQHICNPIADPTWNQAAPPKTPLPCSRSSRPPLRTSRGSGRSFPGRPCVPASTRQDFLQPPIRVHQTSS